MPLVVALGVLGAVTGFLLYAVAREPGPTPADVAIGYEAAWDRLDFATLYDLSGPELRDGRKRDAFVAAKRAAYDRTPGQQGRLGATITVESIVEGDEHASVLTRVTTPDGSVRNDLALALRQRRWEVVAYSLHREPDGRAPVDA